jgi:hypothetical protein
VLAPAAKKKASMKATLFLPARKKMMEPTMTIATMYISG